MDNNVFLPAALLRLTTTNMDDIKTAITALRRIVVDFGQMYFLTANTRIM